MGLPGEELGLAYADRAHVVCDLVLPEMFSVSGQCNRDIDLEDVFEND